ncbi:MAG: hypothetical protein Q7S34_00755 [bacterium]|nr:hypothetical protein [bacterium]
MNFKNQKGTTVIEILIVVFMFFVLFLSTLPGKWVSQDIAIRALEKQGYTNVQITEHNWFLVGFSGCDDSDVARFKARATNPVGKKVEVFVCTGWLFKGATIRTD